MIYVKQFNSHTCKETSEIATIRQPLLTDINPHITQCCHSHDRHEFKDFIMVFN